MPFSSSTLKIDSISGDAKVVKILMVDADPLVTEVQHYGCVGEPSVTTARQVRFIAGDDLACDGQSLGEDPSSPSPTVSVDA